MRSLLIMTPEAKK